MEDKDTNKLIEETLNSLSGIEKADASPFLYEKIMERRMHNNSRITVLWSFRWQLAALSLLLILNTFILLNSFRPENHVSSANTFANDYFGGNNSYNY